MSRETEYDKADDRITRRYEEQALFKDKNKEEFRARATPDTDNRWTAFRQVMAKRGELT